MKLEEVENLDCESRYEVFIGLVAEERDIWILINEENEFLTNHLEDNETKYLPVWPSPELALRYCKKTDEKLTPKSISVPQFFSKWVSGLEGDDLQVGVFPISGMDVWIMEPSEIKSDLQEEFSNFGV